MNPCRKTVSQWVPALLTGLVLLLVLSGCSTGTRPPDVYQVELHRSQLQTLRLTNTHGEDLVVLSRDGMDRRTLEPGAGVDVAFVVVTLKDLHLDPSNPWYVIQDTVIHYVDQPEAPVLLENSGTDIVMHLRTGSDRPDPLRLSLHQCPDGGWEKGPAASQVHTVGSRSVAGVPSRLCPR